MMLIAWGIPTAEEEKEMVGGWSREGDASGPSEAKSDQKSTYFKTSHSAGIANLSGGQPPANMTLRLQPQGLLRVLLALVVFYIPL